MIGEVHCDSLCRSQHGRGTGAGNHFSLSRRRGKRLALADIIFRSDVRGLGWVFNDGSGHAAREKSPVQKRRIRVGHPWLSVTC